MKLESVFGRDKNIVIGAVHLPPSPGFEGFLGLDVAIKNALADATALQMGGVDAIIFENNYDLPHTINVGPEVVEVMRRVGLELRKNISIPLGISVLWNDYRSAFIIAKELKLSFIRVPVFVDTVKTAYGIVIGDATETLRFRKKIEAENVLLLTDIHVKHAELLTNEEIGLTAQRAIQAGSDALIITGKWTGDAPDFSELKNLRTAVGSFPILCGSGVDSQNIQTLFVYADGAIVSTSLKEGVVDRGKINLKEYEARISKEKTIHLIASRSA